MNISDYIFSFYRVHGDLISDNIRLKEDGCIVGVSNKNECMWKKEGDRILFLNDEGKITTEFHTKFQKGNEVVFLGRFVGNEDKIWHVLIGCNDRRGMECFELSVNNIEKKLEDIEETLGIGVRRMHRAGSIKKIMFLIHNMATWDSLEEVYRKLSLSEGFEPIIASIPRCFPGEYGFGHESETHDKLLEKGIDHIRLSGTTNDLNIIKNISPDGIFRQAPWDYDIPAVFSTRSLSFSNLFYIPYYGFNILEKFSQDENERDYYADQDFHRACSMVFCESALTKKIMSKKSKRGGDNFIVTGHPKLEHLISDKEKPEWPIEAAARRKAHKPLRIIWAPHHSVNPNGWLSFGVFPAVYKDMLAWVREEKDIEVVLKPHPALFSSLTSEELMTKDEVYEFITSWTQLPNATIAEGGDYGPLLAASDVMITDGISFLAEYIVFWDKPLIFMENKNHAPFNEIGEMIRSACYLASTVEDVRKCLYGIFFEKEDLNIGKRKEVYKKLIPVEEGAAENVVNKLRLFFA